MEREDFVKLGAEDGHGTESESAFAFVSDDREDVEDVIRALISDQRLLYAARYSVPLRQGTPSLCWRY